MTLLLWAVFWLVLFPFGVVAGAFALIVMARPAERPPKPPKPIKPIYAPPAVVRPEPAPRPEAKSPGYRRKWNYTSRLAARREREQWEREFSELKLARRAGGLHRE